MEHDVIQRNCDQP